MAKLNLIAAVNQHWFLQGQVPDQFIVEWRPGLKMAQLLIRQ
jgi:hypothetical protein